MKKKTTKPVKKSAKPSKKVVAKKPAKKTAKPVKSTKPVKTSKPVKAAKPTKKPFKAVAPVSASSKPVKKPLEVFMPTVFTATKKQKFKKPAVVQTELGLGLVYDHEPTVSVKHRMMTIKKTIVHLVKDNLEPRLMGGKPKKILTNNFTIITPSVEEKPVREKRTKGEKGESTKDFSKYKFQGKLLSKGRLIHAAILKFAEDNNPTLIELKNAFPDEVIRPYGKGLIASIEDAERINTESKRSRFFTKKEDVIKIKGAKIAVSNQIDADLVKRFLTVTVKHGYKITLVAAETTTNVATVHPAIINSQNNQQQATV